MINEKIGTNDSIDISVVRGEPKEVLKKFIMDSLTIEFGAKYADESISAVIKFDIPYQLMADAWSDINENEYHQILGEVVAIKLKEIQ